MLPETVYRILSCVLYSTWYLSVPGTYLCLPVHSSSRPARSFDTTGSTSLPSSTSSARRCLSFLRTRARCLSAARLTCLAFGVVCATRARGELADWLVVALVGFLVWWLVVGLCLCFGWCTCTIRVVFTVFSGKTAVSVGLSRKLIVVLALHRFLPACLMAHSSNISRDRSTSSAPQCLVHRLPGDRSNACLKR